jgi:hypothetical protein
MLLVLAHIFIVPEIDEGRFRSEAPAAVPNTAASVVNSQFAYVP